MAYTLTEAAAATGKSKSTILRSIQAHRISAIRDELTQGWLIEPAELHRVYPAIADDVPKDEPRYAAALREIELLREMLTDKDRQIYGLGRRLQALSEERRTTLRQLTALLTDQQPARKARKWSLFGGRDST